MKSTRLVAASVLTALVVSLPVLAQQVSAPDARKASGNRVPDAALVDEHGDTLRLGTLSGAPLLISPVFTTCPHVCPAITASLMEALGGLGGAGETFNVLTLSFDPEDTPEHLLAYREKTGMPREWILATGSPDQLAPVFDAVDFRYSTLPDGGFAHANAVVFLTPDLEVSGYVHGLMYTQEEVKAALRLAAGRRPLLVRARPFLLPVAAVFLVMTLLVIVITARRHPGISAESH